MMRILVSACLLGYNCKYNGKNNLNKKIVEFLKDHEVIPVCPEMLGGLCCPRIPCEKVGDIILDKEGNDCTKQFIKGAEIALNIAKEKQVDLRFYKEDHQVVDILLFMMGLLQII